MLTPETGRLIDGRAIAQRIHEETAVRIRALSALGTVPGLAFVRVGEDPASQVYVGMKERRAAELGIHSITKVFPAGVPEGELLGFVGELNRDPRFHGILVQAPLPAPIRETRVFAAVDPAKDVDGFHPVNVGKLLLGAGDGFVPCTPAGVHQLLLRSGIPLGGAEVVILGRGNIVGKPMASILMQKDRKANCTVTVVHSGSREVAGHCRRADILVAAMGSPEFVRAPMVKPGAVVIDVGVNRVADPGSHTGTKLVGDVAFEEVRRVAGWITPNPGGVGPMTIAMLMSNTVTAAERATS